MDNWHTAQCTKPDIAIFPGLNVPACMNCGGICPSDRADNKQNDELQIPSAGKRSAMQLNWPPSMSYQSYAYRDDPDGSLHKALASQVDQEWCDKEPGKHTPCSSIIKTAQTPSSQVSKTSYEPLDSTKIRVLRLYKGHFGDCLHGEFETISLQNQDAGPEEPEMISSDGMEHPTPYEAVSYTWAKGNGKREKDHAIFIGSRWDILPITENCFDALQNCRLDDQDRRLWVDAICINQSNISERTHQVGMMRYIYSTASRVLIYLGIGDSGSGSEITDDPEILSGNQYFSRIWVVQEIASAKQALVLYDRKAMHWGFFHGNLQRLSSKRWMQNFGSPRQIDDAHEFLTLLGDTRDCNASDPRDKIFALLGLWKKQVDPDYTLSPQAVYTGLASTLVTDERWEVVAQLLDMATHGRSMLGLPSWVPDWSEKSQQPYHRQWNSRFSLPVRSLSDGEWRFRIHRQTGSLCVLAAKIDILASYLSCGFRMTTNGMMIAKAGCVCVSLAPEVLSKCEPNDCILALSRHKFCLILRKKADPNIYTFIGLCEYSDLLNDRGLLIGRRHQPMELDAIRYLQDWAWLLSLEERPFWSEFATWEKTQICWSAIQKQRKIETRMLLQRVIKKALFLKKMRDLAREAQCALKDCSKNEDRVTEFFKRQWTKGFRRWQQVDKLLVMDHEEHRSVIRKLLPGYRSLEPLQGTSTQYPLRQSMWLPVSPSWFGRVPLIHEPIDLCTEYPLIAACASMSIPLPPLHLITDVKRHIALSLGQGLENGLRQLQRLALEHFPQELLAHEKLVSYSLKTSYSLDFKEKEWAIFLHWLSRPISPSYDMLRHGLRMDAPLIWEVGLVAQTQLEEAHTWLDDNFDHHIETLYSSSSTEPSLDKFFKLIYREQFELLWLFVFRSYSTDSKRSHRVALDNIGAGFARAFFWRFDRSISKACQAVGVGLPTQQEIEKQWNRFLGWLRQQPFEEPVWDIPSEVYDERPRWLVEEERSGEYDRDYFLKKIKYDGLFMVPKTPESPQAWPKHVKSHARLQPQTFCGKQRLSELVHSEIQRRRLPERVFAFLFDDAEATPQPTTSECTGLEELLARDQLSICGGPFTQRWRQETESWKVVEQYISESQWHMSRMKMGLLCGSEKDGVMYKEIVVV
ncbi:hypothetical protein NOF04DRAFT_17970 [Fusarium oxysporum II5]|uniref:Heterokaryon incompatibility domain-containing protein n=1 Tax=Fusarium odoratissimum (strain NRRL 54006) TaxID=1089451 RepID=X0J4S9_FUSO5|nr:uncharacterized protein FOIG_15485 [Fusarium odoratissimum NRRL 54006]EXL91331.1 hypothetical protein FOIG_15485 [Fusarium odoratissimum NRRL 54006]KAK2123262.1 hypothetical protein NOF04DRAFT_17970 [Fusarium oxysporum II5]